MTITYTLHDNLYINLTNRCPNACEFCLRTHSDGYGDADNLWLEHEPTVDEVMEDLKQRDLNEYRQIVFCGYGEPTCRFDDLITICKKIKELYPHLNIRINTNGLADLINGRKVAPELDGLVDEISISLNASSAEKYNAVCHPKFGLDAYPAILKFATSAGLYVPKVYMSVVDNMPGMEIAECKRICERTGAIFRVRPYEE